MSLYSLLLDLSLLVFGYGKDMIWIIQDFLHDIMGQRQLQLCDEPLSPEKPLLTLFAAIDDAAAAGDDDNHHLQSHSYFLLLL